MRGSNWKRTRASGRLHMPSTCLGELLDAGEEAPQLLQELREVAVDGIRDTIEASSSMQEAAEALGISRSSLYRYLRKFPELEP